MSLRGDRRRASWAACASLLWGLGAVSAQENAQEKEKVAPFERVVLSLTVFAAEKACKGFVVDRDVLNGFLVENGITALQLSSKGPYKAELVTYRRKLRREFQRRNAQSCDLALAMFGPDGTAIRGVLSGP
jgi:hypothetical protein